MSSCIGAWGVLPRRWVCYARMKASRPLSIAFLCFLLPTVASAETTVTEPARLWVSQSGKTHQLLPGNPAFDQHVAGKARGMAVDAGTRQVWLHTDDGMFLHDAEGAYQMGWVLPPEGVGRSSLVALSDTSLWIADQSSLKAFGLGGQALHEIRFPGKVLDLALDESRSILWVLTTAKVVGIHPVTGEERIQFNPHARGSLQALTVDPLTGDLWIGHGNGLLHLHADGSEVEEERADVGPAAVEQLAVVIADDRLIGFWVADGPEVALYDPGYREMFRSRPFGTTPQDRIEAMALDPHTGTVWVSNGRYLAEISPGSENTVRYDLGESSQIEALMVQRVTRLGLPPTIEILSPAEDETIARDAEIAVRFTTTDFPVKLESLVLSAGSTPIKVNCRRTDGQAGSTPTIEVSCAASQPLASGSMLLSATVADGEGLRSEPAVVRVGVEETAEDSGPVANGLPMEKPTYTPIVSPRGFRPNTPFLAEGDYDYVSTSSGNLTISIPLGAGIHSGPVSLLSAQGGLQFECLGVPPGYQVH